MVATDLWHRQGIPANPAGWIVTTARNRALDVLRRATRGRTLYEEVASGAGSGDAEDAEQVGAVSDDRLRLIFTCCHPALRTEHRVALTLRLLVGLSVDELPRAFLVTESAMAKSLVRTKYKINAANIPYRVPNEADLPDRLRSVRSVIYSRTTPGSTLPPRTSLRDEAIRVARTLVKLMPEEPEAAGLLVLMLLSEARAPTRVANGSLVLLRDQDRIRWNRDLIDEGRESCDPASGAVNPGHTNYKQRSTPCTATLRRSKRPTGTKSSQSTTTSTP